MSGSKETDHDERKEDRRELLRAADKHRCRSCRGARAYRVEQHAQSLKLTGR